MGLRKVPSAYQIRYGGCKGMLALDPNLPQGKKILQYRDSMRKFDCSHKDLEICEFSRPSKLWTLFPSCVYVFAIFAWEYRLFFHSRKKWPYWCSKQFLHKSSIHHVCMNEHAKTFFDLNIELASRKIHVYIGKNPFPACICIANIGDIALVSRSFSCSLEYSKWLANFESFSRGLKTGTTLTLS